MNTDSTEFGEVMPEKIYTVSELNSGIRSLLEGQFASVWLTGEVSNFKAHHSGHYYFSLKDKSSQISSVMFRGSNRLLRFQLEDGLEVIAQGRVTVYEPRGNYQLVLDYIEPKGLGALQLAFEQLKKKLEAEGLFDASRKKSLPLFPRKIGLITSSTGAAIRDLIHVLKRRCPSVEILLIPVSVQGEKAAPEIAAAIEEMNTFEEIEVMIVGRGGGSLEDLWAFNTEKVARAIVASKIPVISAVGHEIDITLADYVADLRAATPSAAAELVMPVKEELKLKIQGFREALQTLMRYFFNAQREKFHFYKSHLKHPRKILEESLQRVDELEERLILAWKRQWQHLHGSFVTFSQTLKALSPLAVLKRGYSITYLKKGLQYFPLKRAGEVEEDSLLDIWLSEGKITAITKGVDPKFKP